MSTRHQLLERFQEVYNGLNPQQRRAVDQTEGPVMVIAGPGTGKTQILSARIGKILLGESGAEAQNILCLTYTDAGAIAMRRRLQGIIGPDAYRVQIQTFHAFCNEIIQDNLHLFEKTELEPVSDLERNEMLRELIDGFGPEHPLKRFRGEIYHDAKALADLFSSMKAEGWTTDYICQKCDEHLESLLTNEDYIYKNNGKSWKKGDLKTKQLEEQTQRFRKVQAACREFNRYKEIMRARNRYDFDDMIGWVLQAFAENEALLLQYQERYQYVLVDEFQDTSGSQNRLVQALISFWEVPNVFVVGDDDQSIFRFQGANVENMLSFAQGHQQDLLTVVLTANYRSTQPILNLSKTLIEANQDRLVAQIKGLTKDLTADGIHGAHPDLPECRIYTTSTDEFIGITETVMRLLSEGVKPAEIGIIYKENKWGEELMRYFGYKKIPYYSRRKLDALDQPLIRQLLKVLDYIAAENEEPYTGEDRLFEILHFEQWAVPPIEIAKAAVVVNEYNYKKKRDEPPTSLRRWILENEAPKNLFDAGLPMGMVTAVRTLDGLVADVHRLSLLALVEKVVRECGFLSLVVNHAERVWMLQLLTTFYNHIRDEAARNPTIGLRPMLDRLDIMRKEKIGLPVVQVGGAESGVALVTCHGSKGLEWEHVFFAGCHAGVWEKKKAGAHGFAIPPTVFSSREAASKEAATEELRRLFYVALTRARKHLTVSYSRSSAEGKDLEPSMFLEEARQEDGMRGTTVPHDAALAADYSELLLQAQQPEIAALNDSITDRFVQGFVMSASALNCYLQCPLQFYFTNVVRIPSPRNEAMQFGSAVHFALERLFQKMVEAEKVFPPVTELIIDFRWHMHRHRQHFSKEAYGRRLDFGATILTDYYNRNIDGWSKNVSIERNIRNVSVDDMLLKGKIDKLEYVGRSVHIVDYKTGNPEYSSGKFARPYPKQPNGGDYWRQAVFYHLLAEAGLKDHSVASVSFDYIEPNNKGEFLRKEVVVDAEDIAVVKEQIRTVYQKVRDKDFYTGCGELDCHWCGFVKTHKMHIALHEIEQEVEEEKPVKFGGLYAV